MAEGVTRAITVVYGPQQGDREKIAFLEELKNITTPHQDKWIVLGDFGLICQAEDKNNTNLNRRLMGSIKAALDTLNLKEIQLNDAASPGATNTTILPARGSTTEFFCTVDWETFFSKLLSACPLTDVSDHSSSW